MAQRISGGLLYPAAAIIAGHNETHRSLAAIEITASAKPHYDGPEYSETSGAAQLLTVATPTTLATAVDAFNATKALLNLHYGYHNSGSGLKIYAHKAATTLIAVSDLSAGSVYEAQLLTDLSTLISELRNRYIAHIASATFHAAADGTYILGATPAITSFDDAAVELNNLKAQYNLHIAFSSGGSPHPSADGTNAVTAANASSSNVDTLVTLANQLKSKFNAHRTQAGVHSSNDTTNIIAGADVALSTALTDGAALPNTIRSSYEAHRASTSYHDSADATYTITANTYGTVAQLIALALELHTDVQAHVQFAPISRAMRGV